MCGISGGFDAESHLSLSDWTKLYKKKSQVYQQILGCTRHETELIIFVHKVTHIKILSTWNKPYSIYYESPQNCLLVVFKYNSNVTRIASGSLSQRWHRCSEHGPYSCWKQLVYQKLLKQWHQLYIVEGNHT